MVAFLVGRLVPPAQGLVGSLINKAFGPKEDARVVAALARSLFTLDPGGAKHVLQQLAQARPELRMEIDSVLAGR